MYLKNVTLRNFRSFDTGQIELQKDLTVFVGENNGGKSNAIDAIRLLTPPLGGRREIYCESTDVRFQSTQSGFELESSFGDLSAGQQGRLISAVTDASMNEARFGLKFSGRADERPHIWAGKPGNSPEHGCHDMIRHVYLPPLRDAKRALASGNPTRIMALLNHFLGEENPDEFAQRLARSGTGHEILTRVEDAVGAGLKALTSGVRLQSAGLGFSTQEKLIDIARDLRFKLADHGVTPEDLQYSGHGYANLLFMATIAVELENVKKSDLTLFLVEEPEAHLHPQLQAAVLGFLMDQAEASRANKTEQGPAGEVQVIVATHSPNLSAWVSNKNLVVFKSTHKALLDFEGENGEQCARAGHDEAVIETAIAEGHGESQSANTAALVTTVAAAALRRSTQCLPLASIALTDLERRKIDRYLDVTKAALLFGGRVLLVEGIAEAILLPVIASRHTLKDSPDKLRLFRSTVFVPIDGVDFVPYVKLLLTTHEGARIADHVVVITDGDKGESTDDDGLNVERGGDSLGSGNAVPAPELLPGEKRKKELEEFANTTGASECLKVLTSTYSLESELLAAGNNEILRKAYLSLHPRSGVKWDTAADLEGDERAFAVNAIFNDVRKGDFAQILADLIGKGDSFIPPAYIVEAIEAVVS